MGLCRDSLTVTKVSCRRFLDTTCAFQKQKSIFVDVMGGYSFCVFSGYIFLVFFFSCFFLPLSKTDRDRSECDTLQPWQDCQSALSEYSTEVSREVEPIAVVD